MSKQTQGHTPGPWKVVIAPNGRLEVGDAFSGATLAVITPKFAEANSIINVTMGPANARLIAAAPELLEALKACMEIQVLRHLNPQPACIEKAQVAIRKAEGRA